MSCASISHSFWKGPRFTIKKFIFLCGFHIYSFFEIKPIRNHQAGLLRITTPKCKSTHKQAHTKLERDVLSWFQNQLLILLGPLFQTCLATSGEVYRSQLHRTSSIAATARHHRTTKLHRPYCGFPQLYHKTFLPQLHLSPITGIHHYRAVAYNSNCHHP